MTALVCICPTCRRAAVAPETAHVEAVVPCTNELCPGQARVIEDRPRSFLYETVAQDDEGTVLDRGALQDVSIARAQQLLVDRLDAVFGDDGYGSREEVRLTPQRACRGLWQDDPDLAAVTILVAFGALAAA